MPDTPYRGASARAGAARPAAATALMALITRLHFYVGLFVGPFILVAAVTGTLFVLTPQIENRLYADQLYSDATGPAHTLTEQIAAARAVIGPEARLAAIRPASTPGTTTRVMFSQPGLQDSEHRAIFIDPVTLAVKGDLNVYGTSGTLPLRTALDTLHRNLMLGDLGRNYSELAASWLWFAALGGIVLWAYGRRRTAAPAVARSSASGGRLRLRRVHSLIGLWIAIGLFFLSATGLTWSRWAGGNINVVRQELGWVTPGLATSLKPGGDAMPAGGEHAEHMGHGGHAMTMGAPGTGDSMNMPSMGATPADPASKDATPSRAGPTAYETQFDRVVATARAAGIDANDIEVRPPRKADQAWTVREVDRSWPTQVDAVAIDGRDMSIVSRADFANFPLVAKLIRWGIDTHMGILFGWPNQLLMAAFGIALSTMIVLGYAMWWRRRPAPGSPVLTVTQAWSRLPGAQRGIAVLLAAALGWSLPLMGLSFLAFLLVDVLRWRLAAAEPSAARRALRP
ncbi:PepSY domain-containing protein [Bordetella sputigena]|uniref:PepSY-associated TM helix domain-containing protein n=1 Tax=Bordetella sputigena TaxID=1416810 RepID=UPI0039EF3BC5